MSDTSSVASTSGWRLRSPRWNRPLSLTRPTFPGEARQFSTEEKRLRQSWLDQVANLARQGKTAVWGAGAKGVSFVNLIDPSRTLIDCVVDINPSKQGRYVPGTGHPIVDYRALASRGVQNAILMNPNYRDEVHEMLTADQIPLNLVS